LTERALVAGGGGFIGGHLVRALLDRGLEVRAADVKPLDEWHQVHVDAENVVADLSLLDEAHRTVRGARWVYDVAADMGGMGFIATNKAACMLSVLTGVHLLIAARDAGCERFFYASSACVYATDRQTDATVVPLRETDAYPAMPEDGYGWEKLFMERMCHHFTEDFGLQTRVARYHNVYGPHGTWRGGREKAPAAICRKVAVAATTGDRVVEVWGDGKETRSFTYIDDGIEGTLRLMESDADEPLNVGSSELVTIDQLVDLVAEIAGVDVEKHYDPSAPQGVRGRNSDNTLIRAELGWEPQVTLKEGLEPTYDWTLSQVTRQ
jgi:nucleoside-diphosphate-sugar epimerase